MATKKPAVAKKAAPKPKPKPKPKPAGRKFGPYPDYFEVEIAGGVIGLQPGQRLIEHADKSWEIVGG